MRKRSRQHGVIKGVYGVIRGRSRRGNSGKGGLEGFGFMALCNMKAKLSACFELIGKTTFLPVLEGITAREVWRELTGHDPYVCPKCKTGRLKSVMLVASGIKM